MSLQSGQRFGSYEILELIGRGGMGEVYLARDSRLNRHVAIKILPSDLTEDKELLARFRREAALAARLNHPNICTVHETGEIDGQTYICMEYVEGQMLRDRIGGEPIPYPELLEIGIQVADALEEARKKNVVHRDVKSANIVLTARGTVKILDFGLAKQLPSSDIIGLSENPTESTLTHSGYVRGTAAYMSPEQALGHPVDHRSDIFSFGVVLYEMTTGRLPFNGASPIELADEILHKTPPSVTRYNDTVPPEFVRILKKMMEKDPDVRYQSVHEVWVNLRQLKGESTAPGERPESTHRRSFLQRLSFPIWTFLATVVVAGVFILLRSRGTTPDSTNAPAQVQRVSVAVLPFRYTGNDPSRGYLGQLVTDGLIAALEPVSRVTIAPYATVREITASDPIQKAFRDLGVRWIIRGAVSVRGEDTEITTEVYPKGGTVVSGQTLRGRTITALNLAKRSILEAIQLEATSKEIEQVRTPSVDAYRNYLEARNRQEGWDVEGNLDEAIRLYQIALDKDPDFAAARAGLAVALLDQFRSKHNAALLSSAAHESQRAVGVDPDLPEALIAYGMVQVASGNSIEARDAFSRALQLAPGNDFACANLGAMYSFLGRNKEAEEMYLKAISLRPSYWRNYYKLGVFEWQYAGDLEAAKIHLEKANQLHPEGFTPLVMLGNISLTRGDLAKAEDYFRKALERSPNLFAYSNLGLVYYYRGQFDLALRNWQALLKEAPDKPLYQTNVADALRQLGRNEEAKARYELAIREFRKAVNLNSSDDQARALLAMTLAATGNCSEAIAEVRNVLFRHSDSAEFTGYAALTAARCNDDNWAREIVLKSIADNNLLTIRFDPDLQRVRELQEVKLALQRATSDTNPADSEKR